MFMQSQTISRFITVVFLGVFTVTSVMTADDSYARQRDRRIDRSPRVTRKGDDSFARRRGKRRIISPRAARRGHVVPELPRWYRRVWYRRVPYFYFGGVFYRPVRSGFMVVGAPIGAVVVSLPVGYSRIWVAGLEYYVYGGVFYRRVPSGYVVVEAPVDIDVEEETPAIVQPPENAAGKVSVTASVLNVRTGPGLSHPVVYQIHEGYILEVHGKADGWLFVKLPNGEFGWVMTEFTIRLEPPASG